MTLRIERYKNTRHWALYDGAELVVVTVYRRGAREVQRRLAAQPRAAAANGQAPSTPPPAPPSTGQRQAKAKTGDQATGFCSLHNVAMEHRENERGSWYSHWLPEEERHCKGRR